MGDAAIAARLAKAVCKFPSEWNAATIDARWSWLKTASAENPTPLEAAQWHWHPLEFMRQFRRCPWLSADELTKLLPRPSGPNAAQAASIPWATAQSRLQACVAPSNKTMRKFGMTSRIRQTHFLAQTYIETALWRTMEELGRAHQQRRRDGTMYWPAPAMQYYQAFYGRGAMQLTWAGNYDSYGQHRAFADVAANHRYADDRITHTSTHYWADPRDRNGHVTQAARQWFPRYDPNDIATNSFYACDSAGYDWTSKNTGGGQLNINRTADQGGRPMPWAARRCSSTAASTGLPSPSRMPCTWTGFAATRSGRMQPALSQCLIEEEITMFMWTSHRSGHASRVFVLCAALAGVSHVHAATDAGMRKATAPEVNDVKARAVAVFKDRDDFPEEPVASLKPEKTLVWSAPQGGRLLMPVTVRFKGVSNAYCRLVTVENGQAAPVLVDLPADMNADTCRGFRDVRYLDINGDGQLDIAASMTVKANAFDGYVDQPVVYLSNADKPGGYCYSAAASRNLEPAAMGTVDKVRQALDRERKRLGVAQFDCAAAGAH